MDVIANGNCVHHLEYLLIFLAAWKERPVYLTPMAYQWCSAFSSVITRPGQKRRYTNRGDIRQYLKTEKGFNEVGPGCDLDTPHAHERLQGLTPGTYADFLLMMLEVGFRLAGPHRDWLAILLNHTPHHDRVFGIAFSSYNGEAIADAVCAWIADGFRTPAGSFARHFSNRMESSTPLSPRLRQVGIRAIGRIWSSELTVSALETVHLLNRLNADVDDVEGEHG